MFAQVEPYRQRRRERDIGRELCLLYARPLLAMAVLLLDDFDAAGEVVSDTIAAACRRGEVVDPGGDGIRIKLANSVYQRCEGRLATRERFGQQRPGARAAGAAAVTGPGDPDRALLALAVFGGQDLAQVATTVTAPSPVLLDLLQEILTAVTDALTIAGEPEPDLPTAGPGRA